MFLVNDKNMGNHKRTIGEKLDLEKTGKKLFAFKTMIFDLWAQTVRPGASDMLPCQGLKKFAEFALSCCHQPDAMKLATVGGHSLVGVVGWLVAVLSALLFSLGVMVVRLECELVLPLSGV